MYQSPKNGGEDNLNLGGIFWIIRIYSGVFPKVSFFSPPPFRQGKVKYNP